MRFSTIFFALPLVASVFAAPLSAPVAGSDLEAKTYGTYPSHTTEVISLVTELQASIYAIKKVGPTSTQVEVEACLQAVIAAFDECGKGLGIDISLGVDVDLQIKALEASKQDKDVVAGILTDVIKVVHKLIGGIDRKLSKAYVIAQLLKKIDFAVHTILNIVDCLLVGVLYLVRGLLAGLGIKLDNLLGCLLGGLLGWKC